MIEKLTVRVYGLLVSEGKVLVSSETFKDKAFTKFPGGGLQPGEGILEALKREFREELGIEPESAELFYINDFFEQSAFDPSAQVISIYYKVSVGKKELESIHSKTHRQEKTHEKHQSLSFRWCLLPELASILTFRTDLAAAKKLSLSGKELFR
jgi:8-oxo-dGTP diphosphatase